MEKVESERRKEYRMRDGRERGLLQQSFFRSEEPRGRWEMNMEDPPPTLSPFSSLLLFFFPFMADSPVPSPSPLFWPFSEIHLSFYTTFWPSSWLFSHFHLNSFYTSIHSSLLYTVKALHPSLNLVSPLLPFLPVSFSWHQSHHPLLFITLSVSAAHCHIIY